MNANMSEISKELPADQRSQPAGRGDSSGGFVLVAVLGALALLAAIAIAISVTARSRVTVAANLTRNAELQGVADGVVQLLALQFTRLSQNVDKRQTSLMDGQSRTCLIDGYTVSFTLTRPAGLIDINASPPDLLAQTLRGLGLPATEASKLAGAIIDFRDGDDERQGGGKEQDDYTAARLTHGPKNAPFDDIEELDQVAGMTSDLFVRLMELTTVQSRSPVIEEASAPADLLAILSRGQGGARSSGQLNSVRNPQPASGAASGASENRSRTVRIVVGIQDKRGSAVVRRAVVELAPGIPTGFQFRDWSLHGLSPNSGQLTAPPNIGLCAALL
jgi:general secretion pathway protein K